MSDGDNEWEKWINWEGGTSPTSKAATPTGQPVSPAGQPISPPGQGATSPGEGTSSTGQGISVTNPRTSATDPTLSTTSNTTSGINRQGEALAQPGRAQGLTTPAISHEEEALAHWRRFQGWSETAITMSREMREAEEIFNERERSVPGSYLVRNFVEAPTYYTTEDIQKNPNLSNQPFARGLWEAYDKDDNKQHILSVKKFANPGYEAWAREHIRDKMPDAYIRHTRDGHLKLYKVSINQFMNSIKDTS